jgi:serine/threonine-protein kinase HipA
MAANNSVKLRVEVCLGSAGLPVGSLFYTRQGRREFSAYTYNAEWLARHDRFNLSADLALAPGHQPHTARSERDSVFHGAVADTEPDSWGRRVIARDHAKRRAEDPSIGPLTELDYLLAVDDFSRVGALRLRSEAGSFYGTVEEGRRRTPPLLELSHMLRVSELIERGQETASDLRYLQGKGTSLGGMRPKCTVLDADGQLAIGKFPSIGDLRSVTRGEVLTMKLAGRAGINVAGARIVTVEETPVAVIRRFDRNGQAERIPYQSAASLLQAARDEERSYTEIADAIRSYGPDPVRDLHELWRRMAFNLLATNVDDHLRNHGFLHVGYDQWCLAPAFDLNPFPDKAPESKTWLSEVDGPVADSATLVGRCDYFGLDRSQALAILGDVVGAVAGWKDVALSTTVGLKLEDLADFAPAFEHQQLRAAKQLLS